MPIWLRKMLVVLITIFTFGMVSPQANLFSDQSKANSDSDILEQKKGNIPDQIHKYDEDESNAQDVYEENSDIFSLPWNDVPSIVDEDIQSYFIQYAVNQADKQTMEKFGPRISEKIGNQYRDEILPNLEEAIHYLSQEIEGDSYTYLTFTEQPSKGNGEKIFHILDERNGQDLFRYHVRREHPPQEGYWFSFHYHIASDHYNQHHDLGKIYWDKNTPPKWMA